MGSRTVNGAYAVLLTADSYAVGAKVLAWSLKAVEAKYPLVVLYTGDTLSPDNIEQLKKLGCQFKEIERILPSQGDSSMVQTYYADTWTKLQAFNLCEYERVILLDADMLVRKNLDELMTLSLPAEDWIAASSACLCNPLRISTFPAHWIPENCAYTHYIKNPDFELEAPSLPSSEYGHFNSGMVVLNPSKERFQHLKTTLENLDSLQKYPFPDQDFLNEVFHGKWIRVSYAYNALKTLRSCHANMWEDDHVRIVHYILKKPWLDMTWPQKSKEERSKEPFADVTDWWFDAYGKMTAADF